MYRMTPFSTDNNGQEQLWPQTFFLYKDEVEDFRRDVKTTLAALAKLDVGAQENELAGFVIRDDQDQLIFKQS